MSYSYHIGVRHIIEKNAPFWNANAIEDAVFALQDFYNMPQFSAVELFHANELTNAGTTDKTFACTWQGQSAAGPLFNISSELRDHASDILSSVYFAPNAFELPGLTCNILVPNVPEVYESPFENQLALVQDLPEFAGCLHQEVYGRDKVLVGSLDAQIETLELAIGDGVYSDFADVADHVLVKMKLAQKLKLFFTFRF